jgi:BMFP domain-containing protein YqiC
MQTDNPLLDDLARVASGALGALTGMRGEIEARIRDQLERVLARMDMVTREEFDAVRAMAAKARAEQDRLLERIAALEARRQAGPAQSVRLAGMRRTVPMAFAPKSGEFLACGSGASLAVYTLYTAAVFDTSCGILLSPALPARERRVV